MKNKSPLSLIIFFLFIKTIAAQNITGDIEGRVINSTGAPLSEVNITLQSESLQGLRGASTDYEGYFRIFALPIGSYIVKISFVGYRELIFENVQISLGKTTNLGQIQLQQQTYELPDVVISEEKIRIDPTSTTYGGNLSIKDFENLPLNRDYKTIVALLPHANISYFGDQVNFAGATGYENKYFIDGMDVSDGFNSGTGTNLPYNFIKEVEVKTGGYEAEYKSALGGIINVVTNSGTNEMHGTAFGFYTSNRFTSQGKVGLADLTQGGFSQYDIGIGL
ncbi:MAG TPA: TonB-dependent receptor, partial [Ignavibacteriaceae bacterium]|nr:TonB-dependent receptor [Ignavibacteriaceae bacterium]